MDPAAADFFKDAANVVLGWALGMGTAGFSDWRKSRIRTKSVRAAISREFGEVAYRMIALLYRLGGRHGILDRELLTWMQPVIEKYSGPNPKDGSLIGVAGILRSSDEEIGALAAHLKATTPPLFVPCLEASFAASVVGELHDQEPDYCSRVLDVLAHIQMFNENRENGLYHLRLTFEPGLSNENHQIATDNAQQSEMQMFKRARIIVDKIAALGGNVS